MNLSAIAPHIAWLTFGIIMCIAEMVVPGVFLMWIGIAALLTGLVTFLLPIGIGIQMLVFAVFAIASVYFGRRWSGSRVIPSDDPLLNNRLARLVGQSATLVDPIIDGEGRAQVGDSVWNVRGADAPAGTRMRITGADGTSLLVEPHNIG